MTALAARSPRRDPPAFAFATSAELSEGESIARAALEHVGKAYRITRELRPGVIDCSTLISQSHWVGGAVQTPFIAETQRLAANGSDVPDSAPALPGDLLFAYPSAADSPQGRHNHVGLFMGPDLDGELWVMESREPEGVIFTTFAAFLRAGPRRRFAPNPTRLFPPGPWSDLVRRVPKLGRLGARLTSRYTDVAHHTGVDVYVDPLAVVCSPIDGVVTTSAPVGVGAVRLTIAGPSFVTVLAPVSAECGLGRGDIVRAGDALGLVAGGSVPMLCNAIPRASSTSARLHWELWSPDEGGSPAPALRRANISPSMGEPGPVWAQNPLYALKLGSVGPPASVP